MKRRWLFLIALMCVVSTAGSAKKRAEFRIAPGDATDPQTFSFKTKTGGIPAKYWSMASYGGAATVKIRGIDNLPDTWCYLPDGASESMVIDQGVPIDSIIVDRESIASGFKFVGYYD